ncbi:hypothetical protein [Halosolutus halophilus]|uniref:hypothetical protein n=1 Tax=Halosolutus halophilus TaxID=1552990 RepID=UPI002235262F|nr:hypothetical protein [Halosolutus halophilus]
MDELGEESRIPLLNIEEGDVYVLLGFPIAGLLIGGFGGLDGAIFPSVLLGTVAGVTIVYATPSHLPASSWVPRFNGPISSLTASYVSRSSPNSPVLPQWAIPNSQF